MAVLHKMATTPVLPEELILQILSYTHPHALWTSIRPTSRHFQHCAEDILRTQILPAISLSLTFSLGGGAHHRWYDVRATLAFCLANNIPNGDVATFKLSRVLPPQCYSQALDKWSRLCADNATASSLSAWRVELNGRNCSMPLHPLQIYHEADDTVSIDVNWMRMLSRYFWKTEQEALRLHAAEGDSSRLIAFGPIRISRQGL